jgi:multiple sugar transport system ATP-binding protein
MASVFLDNVAKAYGGVVAVRALTLEIADREFMTLLGPSGCGKSTTLNLVAGLEDLTSGRILFDGQDVSHLPPERRNLAMVFQTYALYPHMTVYQNIAFGLYNHGFKRGEVEERVRRAARDLELETMLARKPRQLSGGQRQRVALARAIVRDPRAFLLDEPLSNLDARLRVTMRTELKRLHYELEKTFIYVTHDQAEALTLSDRIAVLNEGQLQQVGAPEEIYRRPANRFVAAFIGIPPMNFLPGRLADRGGELVFETAGLACVIAPELASRLTCGAGRAVDLGVRPENLRAVPPENPAYQGRGKVVVREPAGADVFLTIDVEGQLLKLRAPPDARWERNDTVALRLDAANLQLFDPASGDSLLWP